MNQLYQQLQPFLERNQAFETALTLFSWDNETLAPESAIEHTSRMIGLLSMESYRCLINDEVRELLEQLSKAPGNTELTETETAIVKLLIKQQEAIWKIPAQEYQEYNELTAIASSVWAKAKAANNFELFAPYLEKIIDFQKRFASYRKKEGQSLYDVLLDDYEEGMNTQILDDFFEKLRSSIAPIIRKIASSPQPSDKSYNSRFYPKETQLKFCRLLAEHIGFDFSRGIMAESAHPFTTELHNHDVRITNHYYENNLESALFSVIHEGGHAIYEMNIADELTQTPAGHGVSMGVHESQSRFYENMLGRQRAFWEPLFPKLKETYPEQLKDVSFEQFYLGINQVEPSFIRTEADELTYPLHVMLRYELEKELIDGSLTVSKLPNAWNQKFTEYFGITPPDAANGVLQDIHWAGGSFGYFPTYVLGSAMAAQLYAFLEQKLPVKELLRTGNLKPIREFLKEHIHQYGATRPMDRLMQDIMGERLNVDYYIHYLIEKYSKIYQLSLNNDL